MKLTIDPKLLADTVAWAARALPNRPSVPVLAGLLLEADGDQLTVSAFDYDVSARATITCDTIAEPGRIVIPGKVLAEVAKALPGRTFAELSATNTEATITCGSAEFTLPLLPVNDFPTLPEPPTPAGVVDGDALRTAAAAVFPAAALNANKPMLTGIRIDAAGDTLVLAATDSYRIASHSLPWQPSGSETVGALISAKSVHDITRGMPSEPVTISINDRLAAFANDGRIATVRLLDPEFIDYVARLAADYPFRADVDIDDLLEAVKRVALVNEPSQPIRLDFTAGQVLVRAGGGQIGRGADTIAVDYEGDEMEIGFQAQFLIDGLAGLNSGHGRIHLRAGDKPALITSEDDSYRYLVMPLRIS